MKSLSEFALAIQPSSTMAIDAMFKQMKAEGQDVIGFGAGEPDFPTPDHIKEAGIQAIRNNDTRYTPSVGTVELRKAICQRLKADCGLDYDFKEIAVSNGAKTCVYVALRALVNPGDEVILPAPYWVSYIELIRMVGGVPVVIDTTEAEHFKITAEKLAAAITPKTKCMILNNPCNPTGIVYSRQTLEGVAKLCVEHNILVFSDEIYNKIVYDGTECCSIATLPGMRERTITMNGFSKAFAMTGWRMGYLAAPAEITNDLLKIHQYTTTCISTFSQIGVERSMNAPETEAEVDKMIKAFARRRSLVMSKLDKIPGLSYIEPKGAFYIFVDVSGTGLNGDDFAARLLEEKYVGIVPGSKLGKGFDKYVRLSYATSDENLEEALKRMAELAAAL